MKKVIRFILAIVFTPVAIVWGFLDWLYESETDSLRNWKRHITLQNER